MHSDEQSAEINQPLTVIHQEKSLYRNLIVGNVGKYQCMTFGRYHARQSCIYKEDPSHLVLLYTRALFSAFYANPKAKRVLIIGLGGGILPNAITEFKPGIYIDTVELDPAVIRAAKVYFGYKTDDRSKVYADDGRVFVRKALRDKKKYDIVIIDAFEKDYIPEHLLTYEFLQQIKSLLNTDGIVASNTFARAKLQDFETATYQRVFGEIYAVDVDGGNRIILASSGSLPTPSKMLENGRREDQALGRFGINSRWFESRLKNIKMLSATAPILTDQYSPANLLIFKK